MDYVSYCYFIFNFIYFFFKTKIEISDNFVHF